MSNISPLGRIHNELLEIFQLFDKDGDGFITFRDLQTVVMLIGILITKEELQVLFNAADKNLDGKIDFQEFNILMNSEESFMKLFKNENANTAPDVVSETFKILDRNNDGYINQNELRQTMISLGENFSNEEIEKMMDCLDRDADGKIGLEDYKKNFEKNL